MSKKVKATGMISQLFRKTEHFEMLLSHDTLLQVRGKAGVHVVRTPIVGVPCRLWHSGRLCRTLSNSSFLFSGCRPFLASCGKR